MKTRHLTSIGLFTAILCILGPIAVSLPFSPVPFSLGTLGVMLACTILDTRSGLLCTILYLLIGFAGLPVFTGFTGGAGKLLGTTGGYMIGYLLLALIGGWLTNKWRRALLPQALGLFIGVLICYLTGTLWLMMQAQLGFTAALWAGAIPYIPFDIIKTFTALFLSRAIQKRLGAIYCNSLIS